MLLRHLASCTKRLHCSCSCNRKMSDTKWEITHCIFDLDGTLLNTETLYTSATQIVLDRYNKKISDELAVSCLGLTSRDIAKLLITALDLPMTIEEFTEQRRVVALKYLSTVKLCPGAERLLRHLHRCNIPLALATSSCKHMVDLKTKNYKDLFQLFNHMVCGGSDPAVKKGKPAPDIFLIAAARFNENPSPHNCLVFEDALNGMLAGKDAEMPVVMIPDKRIPSELCKDAAVILKSLEDFKPEKFGLPPFAPII